MGKEKRAVKKFFDRVAEIGARTKTLSSSIRYARQFVKTVT